MSQRRYCQRTKCIHTVRRMNVGHNREIVNDISAYIHTYCEENECESQQRDCQRHKCVHTVRRMNVGHNGEIVNELTAYLL